MIKNVKYGQYTFPPWCEYNGYVDCFDKTSKYFRSKEPTTLWKGVSPGTNEIETLYVCPKCFLYTSVEKDLQEHKCRIKTPPGLILYDSPEYAIYEVDPVDASLLLFAQSLSLFGRLFLDTKSVCYSLDNFLFYTVYDKETGYCAGFFSKEKMSWYEYNLACIIVFPCFQKRNLGNLLIAFSYHLSRQQGKTGSPEKPLSIHGEKAYLAYWCGELCQIFLSDARIGSLNSIAKNTGIQTEDVIIALEQMGALTKRNGVPEVDVSKIQEYYETHTIRRVFDEKCVVVPRIEPRTTHKPTVHKTQELKQELKPRNLKPQEPKSRNVKPQELESKQLESKQLESKQLESKQLESKQLESKQLEPKQLEPQVPMEPSKEIKSQEPDMVKAQEPASDLKNNLIGEKPRHQVKAAQLRWL